MPSGKKFHLKEGDIQFLMINLRINSPTSTWTHAKAKHTAYPAGTSSDSALPPDVSCMRSSLLFQPRVNTCTLWSSMTWVSRSSGRPGPIVARSRLSSCCLIFCTPLGSLTLCWCCEWRRWLRRRSGHWNWWQWSRSFSCSFRSSCRNTRQWGTRHLFVGRF
jgi:hypothetical protein